MELNALYWKYKRVINRNRQTIARVISVTLTIVLVVALGYLAWNIYQIDLAREAAAVEGKDKSPIKMKAPQYEKLGWRLFAENEKFKLWAETDNGEIMVEEKLTGKKWYSNPQSTSPDPYAPIAAKLKSQLHVTFTNIKECVDVNHNNWNDSILKGGKTYQPVENGIRFDYAFYFTGIRIPVQYTLNENGLVAEILTSEIKEEWSERFVVREITFLPFFGAGGLEDDGYLMIPDGSGSLIEYNNEKQKTQSYMSYVYGNNLTNNSKTATAMNSENVALPVFGTKCNDNGFLAIITSGDASAKIHAVTSKKDSSYNQVYSTAIYREMSNAGMGAGYFVGGSVASNLNDSTDILMEDENYTVEYFFLDQDEADYSGMSKVYREYLAANNLIKTSPLADKDYLVLDLIGAVSINKFVMGIEMPVVTAMTSYNDVVKIVKELKAKGVENIIINYSGAIKGGLQNKIYNAFKIESKLGSRKDFDNMVKYLKEENVILFLETNPVDIYNDGNGYVGNDDGVKSFFNKYGFQYKYSLDSHEAVEKSRWHLLTPQLSAEATLKFAESVKKAQAGNVSVDRIGSVLYSNYEDSKDYISRTSTKRLWMETLNTLQTGSDYVLIHGGNAFCIPYVDVVTDIAGECSDYDLTDQSIPFYQMTFRGSVAMTAEGLNTTVDYQHAFLKALETGCGLKFNLVMENITSLVGTSYNDKTSYSYEFWKDIIVEKYLELQEVNKIIGGEQIIHHESFDYGVTVTTYESATIVINYGQTLCVYNDTVIQPNDYLIITEAQNEK